MVKLWKVVKKIFLISGIAIVLLSLLAALLTYVYEDDIKALAIRKVNNNLRAKVLIRGSDIHLTFFSTFPNAAIQFENFRIMEPAAAGDSELAHAGVLNFQFSPLDFWNKEYHIRRILLQDAVIHARVNARGEPNYLILKPDSVKQKNGPASPLDIRLNNITLKNVNVSYEDRQNQRTVNILFRHSVFSGSFTDKRYDMAADADMVVKSLALGSQKYLADKAVILNAGLNIDNNAHRYSIRKFRMKIDRSAYSASGYVAARGDDYFTDLNLKGEDASIQTILALLPGKVSASLRDYHSQGQAGFSGSIKGLAGKNAVPGIVLNFTIAGGTLKDDKHALGLAAINLSGSYSNGEGHDLQSSVLRLNHLTAQLNGRQLAGQFELSNFKDPSLNITLKSDINLLDLKNFYSFPGIENMSGNVNIDAGFQGRIEDLKHYATINKTHLTGSIKLDHVSFKPSVQQYAYKDLTGDFETDGNNLAIHQFTGSFGHSDFSLEGEFKNLASYLFLPSQNLEATAALSSRLIDLDDFIVTGPAKSAQDTGTKHFSFPAFIAFNFDLKADKLIFGKFEAENITGNMQLTPSALQLHHIAMNTMAGTVWLDGRADVAEGSRIKTTVHAVLKGIDVKQCFFELNNFGQDYFTDKYIKGKLDATVDYSSYWSRDLNVDPGSIVTEADITIYDGEIHRFPQFIALGNFLKVKSLDDIYFSEYTNKIFIRNRTVEIPKMDIKSSAVNMTLAGTHTFDNYLDYKMKINISQLLFGNKKNYEDEFGEIEVDQNGGMNVFLTMKGPLSDYKIKYDAKSSIKNMGKGLKEEKKEISKIFKGNSPNAQPGEELNKPSSGFEIGSENKPAPGSKKQDNNDVETPPVKKTNAEDSARKKAFNIFKQKLKKSH